MFLFVCVVFCFLLCLCVVCVVVMCLCGLFVICCARLNGCLVCLFVFVRDLNVVYGVTLYVCFVVRV